MLTGTVTFLFTDIEGSTRLLLRLGDRSVQVLEDHHRLLREAIETFDGVEVGSEGDGLFAVFPTAPQGLRAAAGGTRALAQHSWPEGGAVRVRMGLHTGEAVISDDDYTGIDVHRAARIADAGHGGQILLSQSAASLVHPDLAEGARLRDLGLHSLKDLPAPEHLYQAEIPGLPSDFPPLRSLDAHPHNLPNELSEFVGREAELAAVKELLSPHRLVTLTGPGGSGKTRLALRVANNLLPEFSDGVFFVPLEAIRDPDDVGLAIVQALGIKDTADRPPPEVLEEHLRVKELLLVLDNFEQVLPSAVLVRRLLEQAPGLRVLITSRELLRLHGEQRFEVPPLAVPDLNGDGGLEEVANADAVALFARRAQASQPDFALTAENAQAAARIVARLDGLPLAIELAAARSRLLAPQAMADRLEQDLAVLGTGRVDSPSRHRTLGDAIAWSHDLLSETERTVFRRLGIFAGGFTLDAAEEVVGEDLQPRVMEALASLVDKSLVTRRIHEGNARFSMLETIREFASEELAEAGEQEDTAGRHASYFLQLAREAEPQLTREAQAVWLGRLLAERDNLRAALRYSQDAQDPDLGLELAGAIWRYWHATGQLTEGNQWLEELLAHPGASSAVRAKGLTGLAGLSYWKGEYQLTRDHYQEALDLYRGIGDRHNEAETLFAMSMTAAWRGDIETGEELADRAKGMFEELEDEAAVGRVLMAQGFLEYRRGRFDEARPCWESSLAVARKVGDLGFAITQVLGLSVLELMEGNEDKALEMVFEALEEATEVRNIHYVVTVLDFISSFAASRATEPAVRVAGTVSSLRETLGGGMTPEMLGCPDTRSVASGVLSDEVIERIWDEGRAMPLEQVIDYARQTLAPNRQAHEA